MVLVINDLLEGAKDRIHNDVSNLIRSLWMRLERLKDKFHELAG